MLYWARPSLVSLVKAKACSVAFNVPIPTIRNMSSFTAEKSKTVAPYGAWKSPITADLLTQKNVRLGEIAVTRTSGSSAEIVFVENRPQEGGRAALVKRTIDLATLSPNESKNEIDLTKEKYNARSGVHEYGGGSMASSGDDKLLFTDYNTFAVFEVKGEEEPKKLTAGMSFLSMRFQ